MKIFEVTTYSEQEIASMLKRDCSKWLHDIEDNMAFRGLRSDKEFIKAKRPEYRKPVDTADDLHKILVNSFKKAGFVANRDNSFFVVGDFYSSYGDWNYGFFPIGDYSFTWSPNVQDLFTEHQTLNDMLDTKYEKFFKIHVNGNKTDQQISNAFNKENIEILKIVSTSYGKQVYTGVPYSNVGKDRQPFENLKETIPHLTVSFWVNTISEDYSIFDDWVQQNYQNTDIITALKTSHEIMIKSDEAYMIREDKIPYTTLGYKEVPKYWIRRF